MLEKVAGAVTIAGTFVAVWGIKMMDLPIFITVPLIFVDMIICIIGIVFLCSEGTILPSARRVEKAPKAGETLKEKAS